MNPIRRELLNGLFVLVLASLMSAAFAAFQVSFNVQLWVLILIGLAVAVGFYVLELCRQLLSRKLPFTLEERKPRRFVIGVSFGEISPRLRASSRPFQFLPLQKQHPQRLAIGPTKPCARAAIEKTARRTRTEIDADGSLFPARS